MTLVIALAGSWMRNITDCLRCSPTQSIFPTNALRLEQYYSYSNIYSTAEYLTPLRVYDICRADSEGMRIWIITHSLVRQSFYLVVSSQPITIQSQLNIKGRLFHVQVRVNLAVNSRVIS